MILNSKGSRNQVERSIQHTISIIQKLCFHNQITNYATYFITSTVIMLSGIQYITQILKNRLPYNLVAMVTIFPQNYTK